MAGQVWNLATPAPDVLVRLHYAYPVILLVFFLVTFMSHSIIVADPNKTSTEAPVAGPGGKPLPRNRRRANSVLKLQPRDFSPAKKAFCKWAAVALIFTFLANAILILLHVLVDRKAGWWCGQHVAVSFPHFPPGSPCAETRTCRPPIRRG